MNPIAYLVLLLAFSTVRAPELEVQLVGNAGVVLSEGGTSLLVDLPYEPGAFGYMQYDPEALPVTDTMVSVITHDHRDHFDPALFFANERLQIIGPRSVTAAFPQGRVVSGDSVTVGAFSVIVVPSPHTDDHRSYRIRWRGRVLHFTGDTELASSIPGAPRPDVLFVTPWLSCSRAEGAESAIRTILYHLRPDGADRVCGSGERHDQGTVIRLTARDP